MNKIIHFPIQVLFQKLKPSKAVEAYIETRINKLNNLCSRILDCHVLIEIINQHHHQGKLFHVSIELKVPGRKLVVSRNASENHAHEDAFVAVRDAFNALQRKLQTYLCKQRGKIKHHEIPLHGHISQILPEAHHGFIESSDGRNLAFTYNSVVDSSFDKLSVGDSVRYVEAANETGNPSASTVKRIGKHHLVA